LPKYDDNLIFYIYYFILHTTLKDAKSAKRSIKKLTLHIWSLNNFTYFSCH